jgi:hypothetical protein
MHAVGYSAPLIDKTQNVNVIEKTLIGNQLVVHFSRPLDSGDKDDIKISDSECTWFSVRNYLFFYFYFYYLFSSHILAVNWIQRAQYACMNKCQVLRKCAIL